MNTGRAKHLRRLAQDPPRSFISEVTAIYGEDAVMNGKVDLYRAAKKLWNAKNHKEKSIAWMK